MDLHAGRQRPCPGTRRPSLQTAASQPEQLSNLVGGAHQVKPYDAILHVLSTHECVIHEPQPNANVSIVFSGKVAEQIGLEVSQYVNQASVGDFLRLVDIDDEQRADARFPC